MAPLTPHPISGTIYDSDGSTPIAYAKIWITNVSTGDVVELQCNADGQYVYDAANFPNGYSVGDEIKVETPAKNTTYSLEVYEEGTDVIVRADDNTTGGTIALTDFPINSAMDIRVYNSSSDGDFDVKVLYLG